MSASKVAIKKLLNQGLDEIEICYKLNLKRWELGNLGFGTGPWSGKMWDKKCKERGYTSLMYLIHLAPWLVIS